jgi:hypothetical protein
MTITLDYVPILRSNPCLWVMACRLAENPQVG